MAKPSIFSRDYERRMKKRRRRILIIVLLVIAIIAGIVYKFKFKAMDFTEIKDRIQAWVDTGKPVEEEVPEEEVVIEEKPQVPEKKYIDLAIAEGVIVKAEYEEKDEKKVFVGIEPIEGIAFNISPSGEKIMILDQSQNIKVFNTNAEMKDATKLAYTSQAGTPYPKESILAATPEYIWHEQAKFINEDKIVYVSQLPFFGGAATHKYVWVKDLNDDSEKTLWELKGLTVVVGELNAEKGININVDGNDYYVNGDIIISK